MAGIAGHQLIEFGIERFAQCSVFFVGLAGEGRDALADGVHLLLDSITEKLVGRFVVSTEAGKAGLEGLAERGDASGYLSAKSGEIGCAGFASTLGFSGDVVSHLCESIAHVLLSGLIAGVETGELVGKLGEARILFCLRLFADEKEDDGENGDDLDSENDSQHFGFPSPLGYHCGTELLRISWSPGRR